MNIVINVVPAIAALGDRRRPHIIPASDSGTRSAVPPPPDRGEDAGYETSVGFVNRGEVKRALQLWRR